MVDTVAHLEVSGFITPDSLVPSVCAQLHRAFGGPVSVSIEGSATPQGACGVVAADEAGVVTWSKAYGLDDNAVGTLWLRVHLSQHVKAGALEQAVRRAVESNGASVVRVASEDG